MNSPDHALLVKEWIKSPEAFAREALCWARMSDQQKQGFSALGTLVNAKRKRHAGAALSAIEAKVVDKIGVSIMSGKGSGKDVFAAACILWFMYCFPDCLIPCTAPTQHQLRDVLWSQIYKQIKHSQETHRAAGSPFDIEENITWQADKLFWSQDKGRKWYAIARTANPNASEEEQKATIAGLHAHYMLVVADEAASVADAAFSQLDTTLTEPVNVALLIFNPTRRTGFALESQTKDRSRWMCLHWNSEDSPFVTRESIQYKRDRYGVDSNIYRVTVLGQPPTSDPDTLIPMEWVMDAVDRDMVALDDDPVVIGIDVARGMDDKSIIYVLKGPETLEIREYRGMDTEQLSGWAMAAMFQYEPAYVMVDVLGMGWGVADKLRHRTPFNIVDLDVHTNAAENHRFYRLRDELWWRLREKFERHAIQIPDDEELIAQLTTPKWAEVSGRIQVDKKREMKKALSKAGHGYASPDKADALCMCMYFESDQLRQMRKPTIRKRPGQIDTWRTA